MDDLARRFPEDTVVQFNYLPTVNAILQINPGNPAKAIEILEAARPYELGSPSNISMSLSMYPVYVRGLAYLSAKQGTQAVAEFQKILTHRGIVQTEPIGSLAQLGLARAYALQGDADQSQGRLSGFPRALERRRPRHPNSHESQGRVREATVVSGEIVRTDSVSAFHEKACECHKSVMVFGSNRGRTNQNQSTRGLRKRLILHI